MMLLIILSGSFSRIFFRSFVQSPLPVSIDLEEPDCIIRPKLLHQYVKAFLLDLTQCFGAHTFSHNDPMNEFHTG